MKLPYKTILSAALFIAFAGVAVFGAYAMMRGENHPAACLGSFENSDCAAAVTPFEHLGYHLDAIQRLSTAVVQPLPFSGLLLVIFLLAFFPGLRPRDADDASFQISPREIEHAAFIPYTAVRRWLALHEKRDPSAACAMN